MFPDDALCAHIQMGVTLQKLNLTFEQVVLLKAIVCTAPGNNYILYLTKMYFDFNKCT